MSSVPKLVTTSKKVMSFHDHDVVVFGFGRSCNELSRNTVLFYLLLKENYDRFLAKMKIYLQAATVLLVFSFIPILVMSIERYLGAYHISIAHQ